MSKFEKGDRVHVLREYGGRHPKCLGTVVRSDNFADRVGVKFDKNIGGHGLNGLCEYGFGWVFPSDYLELVDETKPHIVIAKTDTGYSPNENPKVHQGFDAAAAEAKRLANTIGGEFVVFAPVAKAVAPKRDVEFTDLRS